MSNEDNTDTVRIPTAEYVDLLRDARRFREMTRWATFIQPPTSTTLSITIPGYVTELGKFADALESFKP